MQNLKISFFGPFTLSLDGKTVREEGSRGHKQWRLIKYLILNRERCVTKRELIDAVFGYGAYSGRGEAALNALNAVIHRARKTLSDIGLDPCGTVVFEKNAYRFMLPTDTEIDCEIFDDLAKRLFSSGTLEEMKRYALPALEIYGGFFLNRSFFDEKTRLSAEKYHDNYKRIFTITCGALRREGDFIKVGEISEKACAIDPLCEDFYIERVNALVENGHKERAAEIYREACAFFEGTPAMIPSERFRKLSQTVSADGAVRLILPEKYSDKSEKIREFLVKTLGEDVSVKISLI